VVDKQPAVLQSSSAYAEQKVRLHVAMLLAGVQRCCLADAFMCEMPQLCLDVPTASAWMVCGTIF
jgi:hypothetical protein